ncbi:MAG TPA: hypothetical protein VF669_05380 [Tepidisphaeraceae bacterium]|jgi:hypothetical protein
MKIWWSLLIVVGWVGVCAGGSATQPTADDGTVYLLKADQLAAGAHHEKHEALFGRDVAGLNVLVLRAIDRVQAKFRDGGGYFIGVKAKPAESPIGYELKLFDHNLLAPPRKTSYCSGSTYAALIETMNLVFREGGAMTAERLDAIRMQEADGSRREDHVKLWGHWNADGPGSQYALVQYSQMGEEIAPAHARPGDFANINWTNGGGHSVVFLGWVKDDAGNKSILYWASQPRTNGLGDQQTALNKIANIKFVRLTKPQNLFSFDPNANVKLKVQYDKIEW